MSRKHAKQKRPELQSRTPNSRPDDVAAFCDMQALTAPEWLEDEMLSKQEAVLAEARAEFAKEKNALQSQVEMLMQDTLKLAGIRDENELLARQFGEQREHILQLIRDDEFKESLFVMTSPYIPLNVPESQPPQRRCFRQPPTTGGRPLRGPPFVGILCGV